MSAGETTALPAGEEDLLRAFLAGDVPVTRRVERWVREIIHFKDYGIPAAHHDDIVQDTLAQVWQAASRQGFVLTTGLRAFVRRVAMARCVDQLRRRRTLVELDDTIASEAAPDPCGELLRRDERARLRWALRLLDEACREVIRLHFLEEAPYAEIAARAGRAEATIRVRMFHCMKDLRKIMTRAERPHMEGRSNARRV